MSEIDDRIAELVALEKENQRHEREIIDVGRLLQLQRIALTIMDAKKRKKHADTQLPLIGTATYQPSSTVKIASTRHRLFYSQLQITSSNEMGGGYIATSAISNSYSNITVGSTVHVLVSNRSDVAVETTGSAFVVQMRFVPFVHESIASALANKLHTVQTVVPLQANWTSASTLHIPMTIDTEILSVAQLHIKLSWRIPQTIAFTENETVTTSFTDFLLDQWTLDEWEFASLHHSTATASLTSSSKSQPRVKRKRESETEARIAEAELNRQIQTTHQVKESALTFRTLDPGIFGCMYSNTPWFSVRVPNTFPTVPAVPPSIPVEKCMQFVFAIPLINDAAAKLKGCVLDGFARLMLQQLFPSHSITFSSDSQVYSSLFPSYESSTHSLSGRSTTRVAFRVQLAGHTFNGEAEWKSIPSVVPLLCVMRLFTTSRPSHADERVLIRLRRMLRERIQSCLFGMSAAAATSSALIPPPISRRRIELNTKNEDGAQVLQLFSQYLTAGRAAAQVKLTNVVDASKGASNSNSKSSSSSSSSTSVNPSSASITQMHFQQLSEKLTDIRRQLSQLEPIDHHSPETIKELFNIYSQLRVETTTRSTSSLLHGTSSTSMWF